MDNNRLDEIYRVTPGKNIPWNLEMTPDALVQLVENGIVLPGKTIDLGCGTGNYAKYLAQKGFNVTGVDISDSAIKIAKNNAKQDRVKCNFFVADVTKSLDAIKDTFDFAYDWLVLHHVFPEDRKKYVKNVYQKLNPQGNYLSVCFSEKDRCFGGEGKYRKTSLGTTLYFSSEEEIKKLFKPFFSIKELKIIEIEGKPDPHLAIYVFMEKMG